MASELVQRTGMEATHFISSSVNTPRAWYLDFFEPFYACKCRIYAPKRRA